MLSKFVVFHDIDDKKIVLLKKSIVAVHEFNEEVTKITYRAGSSGLEVKVRATVDDVLHWINLPPSPPWRK